MLVHNIPLYYLGLPALLLQKHSCFDDWHSNRVLGHFFHLSWCRRHFACLLGRLWGFGMCSCGVLWCWCHFQWARLGTIGPWWQLGSLLSSQIRGVSGWLLWSGLLSSWTKRVSGWLLRSLCHMIAILFCSTSHSFLGGGTDHRCLSLWGPSLQGLREGFSTHQSHIRKNKFSKLDIIRKGAKLLL